MRPIEEIVEEMRKEATRSTVTAGAVKRWSEEIEETLKHMRIVASAYTGIVFIDFDKMHAYCEKLFGRPIMSHEFGNYDMRVAIGDKTKDDFIKYCCER